jgi:hypothetical protein
MKVILDEATRAELIYKSRTQSKARFARRMQYSVSNFRGLDLKELFENDYLVFTTPINDYKCIVAFSGAFTVLRNAVKNLQFRQVNLQVIARALLRAFDISDDVKVDCDCADFRYRFAYYATKNGFKYGAPENRPSDITNPKDNIGSTCKHLSRILSNKQWIRRASTVLTKFIRTYPEKSAMYLWDELPDDLKPKEPLFQEEEPVEEVESEVEVIEDEDNQESNENEGDTNESDVRRTDGEFEEES